MSATMFIYDAICANCGEERRCTIAAGCDDVNDDCGDEVFLCQDCINKAFEEPEEDGNA